INVDTEAIELMGEKPWNRTVFAETVNALFRAGGAKAVGVDIVLSKFTSSKLVDKAKEAAGNAALRKVIMENPGRVVLAAQYTKGVSVLQGGLDIRDIPLIRKGNTDRLKNDVPERPDDQFLLGPNAMARIGLIDVDVEYSGDAVPRWVPLFVETPLPNLYHMSLQLVLAYFGVDESAVKVGRDKLDIVRPDGEVLLSVPLREGQLLEANWFSKWENPDLNPSLSMADVLAAIVALSSKDEEQRALARDQFAKFKDALVLIGPTDSLLQDLAPTPFDSSAVPKVGLHGNLVKTMLSEKFLRHPPEWVLWALTFALTVLVSALATAGSVRGLLAKGFALVALGGYTFAAFHLFSRSQIVLPMAAPLGAAFTTSFIAIMWQLVDEEKHAGRIKGMFTTYLSPELVNTMIESGEDPQLGGHKSEITAYFSDIQSFSTFSEQLDSEPLVELMNEYLTACTDIIVTKQAGTLDKYIGDAVVAMFGAPIPLPDHAYRACVATQLVHRKLAELREKWKGEGDKWPEIVWKMQTRIGLNTGECTIGNMGSTQRFAYTMMGDDVNLAARMESGAKSWGAYTMCSEATKLACEKHGGDHVVFRSLGRIVVKGRTTAVPIFEIVGLKEHLTDRTRECIRIFEAGLAKHYAQDWDGAIALFEQSRELEPNIPGKTPGVVSNPSLVYIEKSKEMKAEPPGADWDGVHHMKEK
ncbi:MAG: adenylate/guanylate cyclase domain-containing protein, partial [Verrucomicrobia bacterium]|nr:adenylate/guanylate cyclase domain-containing protein [Verrucomicrobiota bacterium]